MQVPKWLCFAALWIFSVAQDIYDDNPNPDTQNYHFRYHVRDEGTGDYKSQEETKQGDTVEGRYALEEPTGEKRVVTYIADNGGFRANVKYEEGSLAPEDKASQTNSKSGYEFQWLPANPDDIQEGKTGTEDNDKDTSQHESVSTTTSMSEQSSESNSEATTESASSTETNREPSTTESLDIENEIEKVSKESDSSSEMLSTESTSETSNTISETPQSSSESTTASKESAENSMESSTMSSIEGKNTVQIDEDIKPSTEDEQSAEAAESAPLSEEVLPPLQPSQMYLPVISYQNLPFLNLPMLENTQGYSEKPPTIIYASQNFYNPWQWFGNTRRIARDVQQHINRHIQASPKEFQYQQISRQ